MEFRWYHHNWDKWNNDFENLKNATEEVQVYKRKLELAEIHKKLKKNWKISETFRQIIFIPLYIKDLDSTDETASIKMQWKWSLQNSLLKWHG